MDQVAGVTHTPRILTGLAIDLGERPQGNGALAPLQMTATVGAGGNSRTCGRAGLRPPPRPETRRRRRRARERVAARAGGVPAGHRPDRVPVARETPRLRVAGDPDRPGEGQQVHLGKYPGDGHGTSKGTRQRPFRPSLESGISRASRKKIGRPPLAWGPAGHTGWRKARSRGLSPPGDTGPGGSYFPIGRSGPSADGPRLTHTGGYL